MLFDCSYFQEPSLKTDLVALN